MPSPHNLPALDYRAAAAALPFIPADHTGRAAPVPFFIDCHTHLHGPQAARLYRDAARLFGVQLTYSMTRIDMVADVRRVMGDSVRFIAMPHFAYPDKAVAFGPLFLEHIRTLHAEHRCRVVKLWNAPRLRELITGPDADDYVQLDGTWRVKVCELASALGMMFMAHVADPDTWFATKYRDAARYGLKADHYRGLRVMLRRFPGPWILAHLGGSPERLPFLDELLAAHDNLYLDCSATKWIVRELSRHPRDETLAFFLKWRRRILFGTDIVTSDEQLVKKAPDQPRASVMSDLADSPESAFELYCSRFYALRAMFETAGDRPSPIADPDLKMVDPARFTDFSSPTLRGLALPADVLADLYYHNARRVLLTRES